MQSEQLNNLLKTYRISVNWDPELWTVTKLEKLKNYMEQNGLDCCVVSVSGGIDSAVTYKLCKEAQKRYPNIVKKVVALNQPICSSDWALERSKELVEKNDLKVIDQTEIFLNLVKKVSSELEQDKVSFAESQLKSYMRTPVNYYVSQMLSGLGYKSIVMGTGNKDEDGYLAYFCKYGDGAVDVQLISDLHKSQVFKLGEFLKVPDSILKAKPSADLWDGQEDEEEQRGGEIKDFGVQFMYDPVAYSRDHHRFDRWEMIRPFKENRYFKEVHKTLNSLIAFLESQLKE